MQANYPEHPEYLSFEEQQADLLARGYMRGPIAPIDASIASDYPCEVCGSQAMYGVGFRKDAGNYHVYRAYSVCRRCGHCEEF
jgi:hypothetical protein